MNLNALDGFVEIMHVVEGETQVRPMEQRIALLKEGARNGAFVTLTRLAKQAFNDSKSNERENIGGSRRKRREP